MTGILMTQVSTPIIGQAAWLLGKIMDGIYRVMDLIGIHNLGVCIILLTIVIYTLLMPLTIKQQKFSKMSAAMNPELQKVQQKYKGKNDQASMQKMQEETQLVYEKYGVSPTGIRTASYLYHGTGWMAEGHGKDRRSKTDPYVRLQI